jgi:hypothetical protein
MQSLLQRVCWNLDGWRKPSGATKDHGNPGKYGWGHEEWNFRIEDAVEDYVFGFLKYRPSKHVLLKANNEFEIGFWTIDPLTRERWLVGFYRHATPVSDMDRPKVHKAFIHSGIYKRRVDEVREVLAPRSATQAEGEIRKSIMGGELNFKCPVNDVEILYAPIRLGKKVAGVNISNRYGKATLLPKSFGRIGLKSAFRSGDGLSKSPVDASPLAEDGYPRITHETYRVIIPKHKIFSNRFTKWLRKNGYQNVQRETDRVDVEFRASGDLCRAELKICNGMQPRKAIREALGQLLEYNFYGNRQPAQKWLIVLDEAPSDSDLTFLSRLVKEFRMPLTVCWRDGTTFRMKSLVSE